MSESINQYNKSLKEIDEFNREELKKQVEENKRFYKDYQNIIDNDEKMKIVRNDNIIITKTKSIDYLQFNRLLGFKDDLVHAFTFSKHGIGFKRYEDDNTRINSFGALAKEFNLNIMNIIQPFQNHTDNIYSFKDKEKLPNPLFEYELHDIDGITTNLSNLPSLMTEADCVPILIYDPMKKAYANIHSGWRGTIKKIVQKAIYTLKKEYGSKSEDLICAIGPAIHKECFLVNEDVVDIYNNIFRIFIEKNDIIDKTDLFNNKGQQSRIDNILLNKLMMEEMGVLKENIIDSEICTSCNSYEFHSARNEPDKYQVNGCLMMIK